MQTLVKFSNAFKTGSLSGSGCGSGSGMCVCVWGGGGRGHEIVCVSTLQIEGVQPNSDNQCQYNVNTQITCSV